MFHCSNLERQHFVSEVFAELEKSCTLSIGSDIIGKGNRTSENQGSLGKTLGFKDVLLEFIWCPPDVVVLEAQSHLGGVPGIFCGSPRFTLTLFYSALCLRNFPVCLFYTKGLLCPLDPSSGFSQWEPLQVTEDGEERRAEVYAPASFLHGSLEFAMFLC